MTTLHNGMKNYGAAREDEDRQRRAEARAARAERDPEEYQGPDATPENKQYKVTLRFQFPAYDERDGITTEVTAKSKAEAIKFARREMEYDGHAGTGIHQGRQTFSAQEIA